MTGKRWRALVIVVVLAAVGVVAAAGYLQPAKPITPPKPPRPPIPPAPEGTVSFVVNVTADGFNGQTNFTISVKQGDHVWIAFVHDEPYGDFHPIFLSGYGLTETVNSGELVVMEFTADTVGTFGFFCINHDCNIHNKLQNGRLVVS